MPASLTQFNQPAPASRPIASPLPPSPMSWPTRIVLMLIAFTGSAVYAASYRLVGATAGLAPVAAAIGIAAGTAWIGFGFLLLTAAQMDPRRYRRVTTLHWADACLVTMTVGMAVKMIGVGANVIAAGLDGERVDLAIIAPLQLALLIATDIAMGAIFVRIVRRFAMPTRTALILWVVALNGIFAFVLGSLLAFGGFKP